jgi:hypothetical protein
MKDKLMKAGSFLLCTNAFTQRNVTSIGLVMLFFAVYVLAGGKITTELPRLRDVGRGIANVPPYGADENKRSVLDEIANPEQQQLPDLSEDESKEVLGIVGSEDRQARQRAQAKVGTLFTEEERAELETQPIDKKMLVKGADFTSRREQWKLEQSEKKAVDSLSIIEERLRIKKKH